MNIKALGILFVSLLVVTAIANAQMNSGYSKFNNGRDKVENSPILRPGMQIVKVGDVNLLVPEESIIYEQGGVLTLEGSSEYAARRFKIIELHLREIDKAVSDLTDKVNNLQAKLISPEN